MKRKFEINKINFNDDTLKLYFSFINLKHLFRQGWLKSGIKKELCESTADHSFGTAILILDLANRFFPYLDKQKLLELALFHEAGEILEGDITPCDGITPEEKYEREYQAAKNIFADLANGEYYFNLWLEFESQKSPEAVLVKQVDKLEMALQAFFYHHETGFSPEKFYESSAKAIKDKNLKEIIKKVSEASENINKK